MHAFKTLTAIAAPLLRDNIDTDAIIPSREIRTVSKHGLAAGLFAAWRYQAAGVRQPNSDFLLNQPAYAGAAVLLCGANFGCGSSREHAVWALREFGFRVLIAPSFAPIFFDNCINNGLLPAMLPMTSLQPLAAAILEAPRARPVTVDLEHCTISIAEREPFAFAIAADARTRLLDGLDQIDLTLRASAAIEAFRAHDQQRRPWVYLKEAT